MKLIRLAISAYGNLVDREIEFADGLNVVFGPNESGKSTLLNFIVDMLYGQKKLNDNPQLAPSYELYKPADGNYGGELVYRLSDERTFRILRNFGKKKTSLLSLMDVGLGKEVVSDYSVSKNNEVLFLAEQTGLTKEMFVACALVGHDAVHDFSGPNLDKANKGLADLRHKIASAVDSAGLRSAAEAREALSQFRFGALEGTRGGGEIPRLKKQRDELLRLREQYAERRKTVEDCLIAARSGREKLAALAEELRKLEREHDRLELAQINHLLKQTERVTIRIAEIDKETFELERARSFSEGDFDELRKRQGMRGSLAEELAAKEQRLSEIAEKHDRIEEELKKGRAILSIKADVAHAVDDDIAAMKVLQREIDDRKDHIARIEAKRAELERELKALAQNPLPPAEVLDADRRTEAAQLVEAVSSARDEIAHLREECAGSEAELAKARELLAQIPEKARHVPRDIEQKLKNFEQLRRTEELTRENRAGELERMTTTTASQKFQITIFSSLAAALLLAGVIMIIIGAAKGEAALIILGATGAGSLALAGILYTAVISRMKKNQSDINMEAETIRTKIVLAREAADRAFAEVADYLDDYDADVPGFLEHVRSATHAQETIAALEQRLQPVGRRIADRRSHIESARRNLAEILGELGVSAPENEEKESFSAYSRRFDEEKRRADRLARLEGQLAEYSADLENARERLTARRKELEETSESLKHLLRSVGFEAKYLEAEAKELTERWHHYDKMREAHEGVRRELERAAEDVDASKRKLEETDARIRQILSHSGALTVDDFVALRRDHKTLVRLEHEKNRLEAERRHMLANATEEQLRAERAKLRERLGETGEGLQPDKKALDAVAERIEQVKSDIQRYREQISAAEAAHEQAARDLPDEAELAEQLDDVETRLARRLEALSAVDTAMAVLGRVAERTHREFSPALAQRASQILRQITSERYTQVHLDPDFTLTVKGGPLQTAGPERLSRGTADQVFLAVRLALSELFSKTREPIPVFVDDPFVNYDEERTSHAVEILARAATARQITVFTCSEALKDALAGGGANVIAL